MDISLINQCISSLIVKSNKLVIPELGALLRKHLPDGKEKITFSTLLRYNDGVLQKEIESVRDLNPEEALIALNRFVEHVKTAVVTEKGFLIPHVGVLKMDDLSDIVLLVESGEQIVKTTRTPRRVADIDIAADTEAAVPILNEEQAQVAVEKANKLDDLQDRLSKLNQAKAGSIKKLRSEVPVLEEPIVLAAAVASKEIILEEEVEIGDEKPIQLVEEEEVDEAFEISEEEEETVSKKFIVWLTISLVICGLFIAGFMYNDRVEKLWKGSAADRWFWNMVDPVSEKIDEVVTAKPQETTEQKQESSEPVLSSTQDDNTELVFEEGAYYLIAGSFSTKEFAKKGLAILKNDMRLQLMPVAHGRVTYVLVAGKYATFAEAQSHQKDWEGAWVLTKPIKK